MKRITLRGLLAVFLLGSINLSEAVERRLSDELARQRYFFPETQGHAQWIRPSAHDKQRIAKSALIQALEQQAVVTNDTALVDFIAWWSQQPVTGAQWFPESHVDRLRQDPSLDPVLSPNDQVIIHSAGQSIAIWSGRSGFCSASFLPGAGLLDYFKACATPIPDAVLLINPGQKGQLLKTGSWNRENERVLLPGARIYPAFPLTPVDARDLSELLTTLPAWNLPGSVSPQIEQPLLRSLVPSSSDFGSVGLLQNPTARFREVGSAAATLNVVQPYVRYNITLQPFDWLEGGFRYTDIRNRLFGPENLSGDQTYKDKSIDAKFKLVDESRLMPALALGLRDIGGTSFFSSEYFVASKRWQDIDATLGVAWGNLATRDHFNNPLSFLLTNSYDFRNESNAPGATNNSYFKGPMSLFGGLEWHLPNQPFVLKLEYDANSYQREPLGNRFDVASPFNVAMVYRPVQGLDAQIGLERGNTLSFNLTWYGNLSRLYQEKTSDTQALPVVSRKPTINATWPEVATAVEQHASAEVLDIRRDGRALQLTMTVPNAFATAPRFERAGRILNATVNEDVRWFDFKVVSNGLPVTQVILDREALVKRTTQWQPDDERPALLSVGESGYANDHLVSVFSKPYTRAAYRTNLDLSQSIGGPNGFILYQLDAVASGRFNLSDNTWLYGASRLRLLDNYDNFSFDGPSGLPRVRTDLRRYLTESPIQLTNFQLTHVRPLSDDHFAMFYAGVIERMFSGIGGEWLWRPIGSSVAVGIDVNRVQKRDFDSGFGLQDYRVTTGHATFYWDTGFQDILATAKFGRYLAGDTGFTLDLSRVFRNGVVMGAYASITSASRAEFGEGSFTKGIYVSVPFDAVYDQSSRGVAQLNWLPLLRDGGAILARPFSLHSLLDMRSPRTLGFMPATPLR